jgi:hypothetical protein
MSQFPGKLALSLSHSQGEDSGWSNYTLGTGASLTPESTVPGRRAILGSWQPSGVQLTEASAGRQLDWGRRTESWQRSQSDSEQSDAHNVGVSWPGQQHTEAGLRFPDYTCPSLCGVAVPSWAWMQCLSPFFWRLDSTSPAVPTCLTELSQCRKEAGKGVFGRPLYDLC